MSRKRACPSKINNSKPAKKLKLITDFSDEFQQLSGSNIAFQTSEAASKRQNQLLHLCAALDRARACGQHSKCQSLCANIRTFLASSLEEKIVCALTALLSSVCPLLRSTIAATRQAASIVIRTLAAKVRPEVLVQHSECLVTHLCSAVTSSHAASLDTLGLLQLLQVSAPHLLLHCSQQLLPSFLTHLVLQTKQQRDVIRKLKYICSEASMLKAHGEVEKEACMAWIADLKNTCNNSSPAPKSALKKTLQQRSSLLAVMVGLVQLSLRWHDGLRAEDTGSDARISTLWLQVILVVASSRGAGDLLRSCALDDGTTLQLVERLLRLLEILHCALSTHVTEEWLAATLKAPLLQLHRLLLPPPPSSSTIVKPVTTTQQLLELRLSLLVLACRCHLYRPPTLHLLTQALCDILAQLETTPEVSEQIAAVYQSLFMNTLMWLQDDSFQHSGQFVEELDLIQWSRSGSNGTDELSAGEAGRADQLLADALEDPLARKSSAWSSRILTELQLLKKLPRHDVKTLALTEYQVLIDPAVAAVLADVQEEKDRRARSLEDWNTRRLQLADHLLDALLQCRALTDPDAVSCLPRLAPLLAWLLSLLPDNPVTGRRLWWDAVLGELDDAPRIAGLVQTLKHHYCSVISSSAPAVEYDDDDVADSGGER
ncbi:hypothetical protein FHG87_002258 [Trinorchestia longiramus]|nr:hypothetical protein FHG87_002258 [Trinorchestia longiramus]